MKIAVNCCYYGETSGGIKEYIYNLVINLVKIDSVNHYIFYVSVDDINYWKKTMPSDINYKIFPFPRNFKIRRSLLQNNFWKKEEKIEKFDLFHSPFFHLPTTLKCKKVITVHDLRFIHYPHSYPFLRLSYLKYTVKKSIAAADKVISISYSTKNDIINYYGTEEDKIIVVHEAINRNKFSEKRIENYNSTILAANQLNSQEYFLSVGHLEPRKNYLKLIKAFLELKQDKMISEKLVIVGKKNYKFKKVISLIKKTKSVIYLEFVDDLDLLFLYKHAKLFIFPSIYEGFGFPPLEAASFGIPSVVSNVSSMPEVCGDGALYFDPNSIKDIKSKIIMMLDKNMYKNIQQKAEHNLLRFSWEKNVKETIKIYQNLQRTSQ
jgi:glycosyltransferase involved in cell wall biosynthesis